eukprot:c14896_g1_i1 orf=90-1262(+)
MAHYVSLERPVWRISWKFSLDWRVQNHSHSHNCSHNYLSNCCFQMILHWNQMVLQRSESWRILFAFRVIIIVFPFLLGGGNGCQLQGRWNSHLRVGRLSNASSIIHQRQQQDQRFQQEAFTAFDSHKTGQVYNVSSTGESIVQAVRLRTGSLRRRGAIINEFTIVPGCLVPAASERVVLVYERLSNSKLFPVDGYELIVPVVGIFAYDASNLSSSQSLPKLNVLATKSNITVRFPIHTPAYVTPFCAYFEDDNVGARLSNLTSSGVCNTSHLGFFSLVAKSLPPAPAPAPLLVSPIQSPSMLSGEIKRSRGSETWKIVVGSVVGGLVIVVLLTILVFMAVGYTKKQKFSLMESHADQGEALQTAFMRNLRAPAAGVTRTQPALESDYRAT